MIVRTMEADYIGCDADRIMESDYIGYNADC